MMRKKQNTNPQSFRFIVDFELSVDERPPALIFLTQYDKAQKVLRLTDEVIAPQEEAKHYDLTAHITINEKRYSFAHYLISPLVTEGEMNNWRQAATDFIAKHAPEQLVSLFKNLMDEASGHTSGAPKAMIANPAETHERVSRRDKRARQKRIHLTEGGRPERGRERSATKIKHSQERARQRKKAIEKIRYLHKQGIRPNNKAKFAEVMSLGSKSNRTQATNNWLRLYGFNLQELILDALGSCYKN